MHILGQILHQVGRDKLEVIVFFCNLDDMLSPAIGCEAYCLCKSALEKIQGATTRLSFLQDVWPCVQLLHAVRNAPYQ